MKEGHEEPKKIRAVRFLRGMVFSIRSTSF